MAQEELKDHNIQLSLYREEQRLRYEKKLREKYLYDKYKKLIELDPIKRAASIIVNAVRKRLLHTPINSDILETIPGKFRLRLHMTELNTFPLDVQKNIFNNAIKDSDIPQIIIESLKESYKPLYWIVIDLRTYGPYPELEIYTPDQILYLTEDQISKVKEVWNRVNPESSNGIRFQQMLDSSKSLSILYDLSKKI